MSVSHPTFGNIHTYSHTLTVSFWYIFQSLNLIHMSVSHPTFNTYAHTLSLSHTQSHFDTYFSLSDLIHTSVSHPTFNTYAHTHTHTQSHFDTYFSLSDLIHTSVSHPPFNTYAHTHTHTQSHFDTYFSLSIWSTCQSHTPHLIHTHTLTHTHSFMWYTSQSLRIDSYVSVIPRFDIYVHTHTHTHTHSLISIHMSVFLIGFICQCDTLDLTHMFTSSLVLLCRSLKCV